MNSKRKETSEGDPSIVSKGMIFRLLTIPLWIAAIASGLLAIGAIPIDWIGPPPPESHPFILEQQAKADFARKLDQDDRVPAPENVSGLWSSGPNLVGYTVQFDLTGKNVVGRGYHWGCLGVSDNFKLTGTYDGDVLSFVTDEHPEITRKFKYIDVAGFPRLREIVGDGEYAEELRTMQELNQDQKLPRASGQDD